MSFIAKIVSGGQTGADRGGLQAAMDNGIRHGGWCPRGRIAEDGSVPGRFLLLETAETDYRVRTERNVVESDATILFSHGAPQGGTALTLDLCRRHNKPFFHMDLASDDDKHIAEAIASFASTIRNSNTGIALNIAGSRESVAPGIYDRTRRIMNDVLSTQRQEREASTGGLLKHVLPLLMTALLAAVMARAEIQIQEDYGSVGAVPAVQSGQSGLSYCLWGARPPAGHHAWMFLLAALLFHFPLILRGRFSLRSEFRILSLLLLFWTAQDFLWFALNPYCGLSALTPARSPWQACWLFGLPAGYFASIIIGALLYWASMRASRDQPASHH